MSDFGEANKKIMSEFYADDLPDLVLQHEEWLRSEFESVMNVVESPIEAMLVRAIFNSPGCFSKVDWVIGDRHKYFGGSHDHLQIAPQFQIDAYRVDFALSLIHQYGTQSRIIVECDGHNYHERTKAQAARDRRRDRDLALQGWKVLRFTGSEIYADADECAAALFDHLEQDMFGDWRRVNG